MAQPAKKFLDSWVQTWISAEAPSIEEAGELAEQCGEDAERDGVAKADVVSAAGGDLASYLREKIKAKEGL